MVLASAPGGGSSAGLGIVILAVGLLMGVLAMFSLRSIWRRAATPPAGARPDAEVVARPLNLFLRALLSFDFGCLVVIAAVLIVLGVVLVLRAAFG